MKRSPRIPVNLSESVHRQLGMYALAASAAGVSLLALTPPAEAKIVYRSIHHVIRPRHSYDLDLNHDGITDFVINNFFHCTTQRCSNLSALGQSALGQYVAGSSLGSGRFALALRAGSIIGTATANHWFGRTMWGSFYGQWGNVTGRYLGLKFQIRGKTHYGWARLNVKIGRNSAIATLTGYAYETIPNKAIIAGRTKGRDEVDLDGTAGVVSPPRTPKPATLGVLATGAPGLSIWRRKESLGATH